MIVMDASVQQNAKFSVGERVEAIWSADGQKYPGRILHVLPHDNYEVLFDDGVKSRRKAHLIYKLLEDGEEETTMEETDILLSSKNRKDQEEEDQDTEDLLPVLHVPPEHSPKPTPTSPRRRPGRPPRQSYKPPTLTPQPSSNNNNNNSDLLIPPPPPLLESPAIINNGNGKVPLEEDSNNSSVVEEKDPGGPPTLTPKPPSLHNKSKPSAGGVTPTTTTNGNVSPLPLLPEEENDHDQTTNNSDQSKSKSPQQTSTNNSNSKNIRGYVYVQKPHYSVFDPPPAELGKRQRKVQNYAALAKGPSLRRVSSFSASNSSNGLEEDEEMITPSSTPSSSRCSSPTIPIAGTPPPALLPLTSATTSPSKSQGPGEGSISSSRSNKIPTLTPQVSSSSSSLLPKPGDNHNRPGFLRKRRFLKSPPKTVEEPLIIVPTTTEESKLLAEISNSSSVTVNTMEVESSSVPPLLTAPEPLLPLPQSKTASAPPDNVGVTPSEEESKDAPPPPESNESTLDQVSPPKRRRGRLPKSAYATPSPPASASALPPPPPPPALVSTLINSTEEVPQKRLRKPSIRFSGEEGYINIFPQRRSRGPRTSTSTSPGPAADRSGEKPSAASPLDTTPVPPSPSKSHKKSVKPETPVKTNKGESICDKNQNLNQSGTEPMEEDGQEELLDVGEHVALTSVSNKKAPGLPLPSSHSTRKVGRRNSSMSLVTDGPGQVKQVSASSSGESFEQPPQPLVRQTSRGRIVRPPTGPRSDFAVPMPKVVVEKCDGVLSSQKSSSSSLSKSQGTPVERSKFLTSKSTSSSATAPAGKEKATPPIPLNEEEDDSIAGPAQLAHAKFLMSQWKHKKRWRKKGRGLFAGVKKGMRPTDSHALQLLKRSKMQQQQKKLETRGRPRMSLLKGITKKKLKKIMESVRRRKLKRKKMTVATRFKDVRVDIINCVCGRTDEFGLMVQCEVCLCWQHGNCFGYFEDAKLPRFYVCQSCSIPKRVRPHYRSEGVRQETYKKGILPIMPTGPQLTLRQQKILKRCYDLNKMIEVIDNYIYQNKLKESIATSEPEHKKLYQWSAPRPHPKDTLQKWKFNKYFKTVLKRLLLRYKGKPEYVEKLGNIVTFREKLKRYSCAFDEAKLSISRKIGSRGLILVEKLAEQESKIKRIQKVKNKLDSELCRMPESMRSPLLSIMLEMEGVPASLPSSSSTVVTASTSNASSTSTESAAAQGSRFADKETLQKYMDWLKDLMDIEDPEEEMEDDSSESLPLAEAHRLRRLGLIKSSSSDPNSGPPETPESTSIPTEPNKKPTEPSEPTEPSGSFALPNDNKELAEEILNFNLDQLEDFPVLKRNEETDNWVRTKKLEGSTVETDLIKVVASKSKLGGGGSIDAGSESEATLSGDTTVSVVDSEGGEEYWYNPIAALNCEYDSMRKFLLHDRLVEYDKKNDDLFRSREYRPFKRDWIDDLNFYLNGDLGIGLDQPPDSPSPLSPSPSLLTTLSDMDEDDVELDKSDSTTEDEDDGEEGEGRGHQPVEKKARFWERVILQEELEDTDCDEEDDPDWQPEPEEENKPLLGPDESTDTSGESEDEIPDFTTSQDHDNGKPSSSNQEEGIVLVCSDPSAIPGEIVNVRIETNGERRSTARGLVVAGPRGQKLVKILDSSNEREGGGLLNNFNQPHNPPTQLKLCSGCQESLGVKWTWKQLNSAKAVNTVLEDAVRTASTEVSRLKQLALETLESKAFLLAFPKFVKNEEDDEQMELEEEVKIETPEVPTGGKFGDLKEKLETISEKSISTKPQASGSPQTTSSSSSGPSTSTSTPPLPIPPPPPSAEEESIISLLSLSKTPVECNGENVSELSIESLRRLTDRLQHNGPLTEDLAKAVAGHPLTTNGKICPQLSSSTSDPANYQPNNHPEGGGDCIRCKLQEDNARKLHILITTNPTFAGASQDHQDIQAWCVKMSKAVEDVRLALQATRFLLFRTAKKNAERKAAERKAKELGVIITKDTVRRRIQLARPDCYLSQRKMEIIEALMPYATHFISRFTKKEELIKAKRSWIADMVQQYNNVKKALKVVFSVDNEETMLKEEDKFYAALDNLRKSFDIVLTRKDIKMRRQKQSFSVSESQQQGADVPVQPINNNTDQVPVVGPSSASTTLVNQDPPVVEEAKDLLQDLKPGADVPEKMETEEPIKDENSTNSVPEPPPVPVIDPIPLNQNGSIPTTTTTATTTRSGDNGQDAATAEQLQEMEIFARLATYPIQEEDVNALLGIANQMEVAVSTAAASSIPTTENGQGSQTSSSSSQGTEQPMEIDALIEANLTGSRLGQLDLNLINAIGSLDKGAEDESDLLINLEDFNDPPPGTEEPMPCSSRSIMKNTHQPSAMIAPSLARLTPEMCKGFLLDDIRAHQQVIDAQLDKLESEIMELERRRGSGIKDKEDQKQFEMLCANIHILLENSDVLGELANYSIGTNNDSRRRQKSANASSKVKGRGGGVSSSTANFNTRC